MKLTCYIVNFDHKKPAHRGPLMKFLGDHRPASALNPVEKLAAPDFLFEIEATAAIPQYPTEKVDVVVVVILIPTPLNKEITFDPPLPLEKQALSKFTVPGDDGKAIVFFKTPWWRSFNLCGMSQTRHGPFSVTRDTRIDADGHYSLTCFMVGQPAREWAKQSPPQRKDAVMAGLQRILAPFAKVEEPIDFVEQLWRSGQWSQGCPCPVMGPGRLTKFEGVLKASAGRIHFVRTETAHEWKRGIWRVAVRSGERGAKEVLVSLARVGDTVPCRFGH